MLRKLFNLGPYETIGGNEVINNQIFKLDSTGYYKVTAGPSTRRIIDFSDIENSLAIIPTGQSGNVFSKYYKNQTKKYLQGKFVKMKLNQTEIEQSEDVVIFKPMK
ncbi:penicillin acylase family protein [Polaribacter sejongensis]|uniref:penicillin acylase family protein n=1 Tax=Polaribacter sejongensis TaxID=985043 RepID=UPI0035A61F4D